VFVYLTISMRSRPSARVRACSARAALALAREWQAQIDRGDIRTRADIAARSGTHPYRVSNILCLLRLHPTILERIEGMKVGTPNAHLNERWLRPISRLLQSDQLDPFRNGWAPGCSKCSNAVRHEGVFGYGGRVGIRHSVATRQWECQRAFRRAAAQFGIGAQEVPECRRVHRAGTHTLHAHRVPLPSRPPRLLGTPP
jgi:hypothetical protein